MRFPVQFDLYRNAGVPLQGTKLSVFNWPGGCLTSQSAVFHAAGLGDLNVVLALWRCCWSPNINNGAQTAVRLVAADAGPSNIQQVAAFFQANPGVRNDAADITQAVRARVESHRLSNTMFQLIHQTAGDSSTGPLIYSSAIELILEV